jgi:hypothetical protein
MVSFTHDIVDELLIVDLPDTDVTIQQIVDDVRVWESELWNEQVEDFIDPSGKQDLGGGVYVGITLKFRYGWRLQFEDRPGPAWSICNVNAGNLVGDGYFPLKESTFIDTVIAQSTSAALLSGGSSPAVIAAAVWDEFVAGHVIFGTTGKALSDIETDTASTLGISNELLDLLENRLVINEATSEWWLYDDAGLVVIKKWPLKDHTGATITLVDGAISDREKRTL